MRASTKLILGLSIPLLLLASTIAVGVSYYPQALHLASRINTDTPKSPATTPATNTTGGTTGSGAVNSVAAPNPPAITPTPPASPTPGKPSPVQKGDFAVSPSSPHLETKVGENDSIAFFIQSVDGFKGQINLTTTLTGGDGVSGNLPVLSLSQNGVNLSPDKPTSVIFSVSTNLTTRQAQYVVIIHLTSGQLDHSVNIPLSVYKPDPPQKQDAIAIWGPWADTTPYRLVNGYPENHTQGVVAGQTLKMQANIVGLNYLGNVTLSSSVSPEEASITVHMPTTINITRDASLQTINIPIDTKNTTPLGTYVIVIFAKGGPFVGSASFHLTVAAGPGDFSLTALGPVSLPALGMASVPVKLSNHDFQGTVVLSTSNDNVTGLTSNMGSGPAEGYFVSWGESPIFGIIVNTNADTPQGTYNVVLKVAGEGISHSVTANVTVTKQVPGYIKLSSLTLNQTVKAGSDVRFEVREQFDHIKGDYVHSYSLTPAGKGVELTSYSGTIWAWPYPGDGINQIGITVAASAAPGTYTLTVTATCGNVSGSIDITVIVTA